MASVTVFTAARMLAIEASAIVSGLISGDNLILTKFDGSTVNAGNVRGPQGLDGLQMWTTATLINSSGTTSGIVKNNISGRTIKIGDLVLSSNAGSSGLYGTVTAVASQSSVTVTYGGSLKGDAGDVTSAQLTNAVNGTNVSSSFTPVDLTGVTSSVRVQKIGAVITMQIMVNVASALNMTAWQVYQLFSAPTGLRVTQELVVRLSWSEVCVILQPTGVIGVISSDPFSWQFGTYSCSLSFIAA